MQRAEATREIFWNVPFPWLMYVLLVPTVAIGGYGLYRRIRLWRTGGPAMRWDRPRQRLALVFRHAVGQARTLRRTTRPGFSFAGIFHLMIYTGFVVLTMATTVVMLDHDFGTRIMRGGFYLFFQSLAVDLFGAFLLVGIGLAMIRRWRQKPSRLVFSDEASAILIAIFVVAASGFLVEGWRIAATDDPWGSWSPIGYLIAQGSLAILSESTLTTAHAMVWWGHCVVTFAFLAWAPYTKLAHVVTAPLNIFFANLDGHAASLRPMDFEADDDATLGVHDLAKMSWKDLLDLDACTECGRCTAACPAHTAGKSLSPRDIVLDLRNLMHDGAETLLAAPRGATDDVDDDEPVLPILQSTGTLSAESLWQCTTCAACMEVCPVYIEQLPKILDVRRYLTMEEAEMPQSMADAMTSLERRGHPYPGTRLSRIDWTDGLDVPVMSELDDPDEVDVLLWIGCATALIERNHSTVRALAQLLQQAGVSFAILGREERCNGDAARRMGNEFLFETMARKNQALLERYGVDKIVTPCPHCFNTFKNDYPAMDGNYQVEHHSTFLAKLVDEGRIRPTQASEQNVTFHDPCYLGRYNREFDAPRQLVQISTRGRTPEMTKSREHSFCCGGGGGLSFAEEPAEQRVNRQRARQALATGADVVGVGCPFCTTMLEDGVGAVQGDRPAGESSATSMVVKDIAELLWDAAATSDSSPNPSHDATSRVPGHRGGT